MNAAQLLSLTLILSLTTASLPAANTAGWETKYEGGSLNLKGHEPIHASLTQDMLVLAHGPVNYRVPLTSITEVSYSANKHYRVGTTIAVAVFTLGVGLIILFAAKSKEHYVNLAWSEAGGKSGGVLLRVDKNDYRGFLSSLESSGIKTSDTGSRQMAFAPAGSAAGSASSQPKSMEQFRSLNPCPSTMSMAQGECPNFVVRHVVPLKCGGKDRAENLKWVSVAEAAREDAAGCAAVAR